MYQVLMLHLLGDTPCYLGAVGLVTTGDENDDPLAIIEELFARFQQDEATNFIEWLVEQDEATEVAYDDDSPNLPLQVYL